jgi:hypothetical protein
MSNKLSIVMLFFTISCFGYQFVVGATGEIDHFYEVEIQKFWVYRLDLESMGLASTDFCKDLLIKFRIQFVFDC